MPLTTTWTRSSSSKCGWAFSSVTRPCVAQRVWPMPVVAGGAMHGDAAVVVLARAAGDGVAQRLQVADRAHGVQPAVRLDGDARGVVSAVLELLQAFEQHVLHERWPT